MRLKQHAALASSVAALHPNVSSSVFGATAVSLITDSLRSSEALGRVLDEVERSNHRMLEGEQATHFAAGVVRVDLPSTYSTALPGEERTGAGRGFSEYDEVEHQRRQQRAADARATTEQRKQERRKCSACHRYACLCL